MLFKMVSHSLTRLPPRIKTSDCVWDLYEEYVGGGITSSHACNFIVVELDFEATISTSS